MDFFVGLNHLIVNSLFRKMPPLVENRLALPFTSLLLKTLMLKVPVVVMPPLVKKRSADTFVFSTV